MILKLDVEHLLKLNSDISFTDVIKTVKKRDKTVVQNKFGYFGYYQFLEQTGNTSLIDYLGVIINVIYNKNNIEMEIKPKWDIEEVIFKGKTLRGLFTIKQGKLYHQGVGISVTSL